MKEIKVTGYWDGSPITRELTPEESLENADIKVEDANLFVAINEYDVR